MSEIEDVSTHDTFDDHDGQRKKKKITSMNITKDGWDKQTFHHLQILIFYFS